MTIPKVRSMSTGLHVPALFPSDTQGSPTGPAVAQSLQRAISHVIAFQAFSAFPFSPVLSCSGALSLSLSSSLFVSYCLIIAILSTSLSVSSWSVANLLRFLLLALTVSSLPGGHCAAYTHIYIYLYIYI